MGGRLSTIFNLKDDTYSKCSPDEIKERIMTVIMIDQSCEERFGDFKRDRNEDDHLVRDDFPAAIALDNYCNVIPKTMVDGTTPRLPLPSPNTPTKPKTVQSS